MVSINQKHSDEMQLVFLSEYLHAIFHIKAILRVDYD